MILVAKAAARPADVGHLQSSQRGHHVIADPARVRNWGIWANPDALVKAVSEIFRKLAEEVAVDLRSGLGCVDGQMRRLPSHEGHGRNQQQNREARDESNTAELHAVYCKGPLTLPASQMKHSIPVKKCDCSLTISTRYHGD